MDEWIGYVHPISPASTFWPEEGVVSNKILGNRKQEVSSEQVETRVIKETSIEMGEEQLEMEHMPRGLEGINLEQYETKVNAKTG